MLAPMSPAQSVSEYRKRVNMIVLASRLLVAVAALIVFLLFAGHHFFLALVAAVVVLVVGIAIPAPIIRSMKKTVAGRDTGSRRQLGR
jgi:fumarate reductase subunit D